MRKASALERARALVGDFMTRTPARFALVVFGGLVVIFTLLFALPVSAADGRWTPAVDAFFTAVSTVCVTGLSTVDMGTHWSALGHVFIVVGSQIGAVGVLTMASILGLVISRRLGLRQKLVAAGDANPLRFHAGPVDEQQAVRLSDTRGLLITVAMSMLSIEIAGGILLFPGMLLSGVPLDAAWWHSLYLSAMAFTNTGFTPAADGLAQFATNPYMLIILMVVTVLGAIGFPVIYSLRRTLFRTHRWSLHVKLTLVTYSLLFVLGWGLYLGLEWNNPATLGGMNDGQKVLQSAFLSAMTRSGGMSTVAPSQETQGSLLLSSMLMFIGGGSASTAGGIKVTTLAVLFLAAVAEARGRRGMEAFGKFIPSDVLRLAVSVTLWGATLVATTTVLLCWMTNASVGDVLFDVISAFATCGLTSGFTMSAPGWAQVVLALLMFLGRIGTSTFAAALAARQHPRMFKRPEERPIVG